MSRAPRIGPQRAHDADVGSGGLNYNDVASAAWTRTMPQPDSSHARRLVTLLELSQTLGSPLNLRAFLTGVLEVLEAHHGALNGAVFVGPRVSYAMATDGLFFRSVARVHPRFRTPGIAILIQLIWSCVLTVSGTFEQLFTFVVFVTVLFNG